MKTQTLLKVFFAVTVCVQGAAQAINLENVALATGAALCVAGYRSASKDARPEKELTTWADVQKEFAKGGLVQGAKAFATWFDDRVIGQDEQGAIITDFAPINIKDAKTGETKTVYLGEGTIKYGKCQGIGALNKKFKYLNAGLSVTQKVGGLIILGVLAHRKLSAVPSAAANNPDTMRRLHSVLMSFSMPQAGGTQTEVQRLTLALGEALVEPPQTPRPAVAGAALESAVTATRSAAGGMQLLTNGISALCPTKA